MKHIGFLLVSIAGSFMITLIVLAASFDGDSEKVTRRFIPMWILNTFVMFCLMEGLFLALEG